MKSEKREVNDWGKEKKKIKNQRRKKAKNKLTSF